MRKYFNCLSFLGQAIFMMLAAFLFDPVYSVTLLTIAIGIGAFSMSRFCLNLFDIVQKYASILMGILNSFGFLPVIVSPILTGSIVTMPVSFVNYVT